MHHLPRAVGGQVGIRFFAAMTGIPNLILSCYTGLVVYSSGDAWMLCSL